ncbi:gamma-glutamylcyclotransferase [Oceanithermus sp.]|uniref:gamma-glutamylcyclotransferase n=1 Tax=Oceanithermus sp. TaxID=2268145 RepID=UPI0025CB7F73|nr:gamma-glutamylcyclotransferase [Oceanithermus sp.]
MEPRGVFVYGSLLPGERYHGVARAAGLRRARPARLAGFRLYALPQGYPAAVPGRGVVEGALFEFYDLARALALLDAFEEGELYRRRAVRVWTPDGPAVAWAYLAPAAVVARRGGVPWPSPRWRGPRAG